ncbi:MAG: 5'/3'-nucleotidase SurE [Acidimicrobiia bacterium]|nr:5'/3'-nucleotidase SurE [Acidimicrobiia bacterium]
MSYLRRVAFIAVITLTAGCTLLGSAGRYAAAPGTVSEPFWCAPSGGTALTPSSCIQLSQQLDFAVIFAQTHFTAGQATAAGAVSSAYEPGVGAAFRFSGPTSTFDFTHPDTLLYDGTDPSAQVAGIEYNVTAPSAPAGFEGPNDVWTDLGNGSWRLRVWMLRPFQNEPNAFADTHPCLDATGPIFDVSNACYTETHPRPLEVLVSNDDGYNAPGIDAIVEGLRALPNVHVTVSAPATNQSGVGSNFTPGPVTATDQTTLSGYPAWAVAGYPVDAVRYALRQRNVNPDLVVSGTNFGQNIGPVIPASGTVGAAREGAQNFVPAVAISQGFGPPPDYPSSVPALLSWINDFLVGRAGRPALEPVTNINVPTCTAGSIRGTVHVPAATALNGRPYNPSDCTSTVTSFADDVDAFINGYISVSTLSPKSGSGT